jgi:hypothetical protein
MDTAIEKVVKLLWLQVCKEVGFRGVRPAFRVREGIRTEHRGKDKRGFPLTFWQPYRADARKGAIVIDCSAARNKTHIVRAICEYIARRLVMVTEEALSASESQDYADKLRKAWKANRDLTDFVPLVDEHGRTKCFVSAEKYDLLAPIADRLGRIGERAVVGGKKRRSTFFNPGEPKLPDWADNEDTIEVEGREAPALAPKRKRPAKRERIQWFDLWHTMVIQFVGSCPAEIKDDVMPEDIEPMLDLRVSVGPWDLRKASVSIPNKRKRKPVVAVAAGCRIVGKRH